ncbi:MAG: tyrosine-type recombinase/integrase [Epsilonproteobacteria bacterium]|nr:tyrosine-type recombinase/integrase [Campylobacterota bacterium]
MEFLKTQLDNYLKYIQNTKSQRTYKTYLSVLKEAIDYMEIDDNHINITPYRLKIANQQRKTIAKKISILRSFFKYLQDNGHSFKISGDEQISVPKTLPKPVLLSHIIEALKVANLYEYTVIATIFGLGLRISEARELKKANIKQDWVEVVGKGNKTRHIPLPQPLQETISKFIQMYHPQVYLFEKDSKQLTDMQLRYIIQKPFQKIGIKVTPHQLRHSFATELINNGARINDVSELLGHEHLSTTQIYTKLNNNTKLNNYMKAHPLCTK